MLFFCWQPCRWRQIKPSAHAHRPSVHQKTFNCAQIELDCNLFDYHKDIYAWHEDTRRQRNQHFHWWFFPVINPFRYLQQVPSFPFEFGWVQHCSVTALSARLNRHLKPLVFCSWMYLSHHLSTSLQARAVHVDLLQGKSMELIERVQPCTNEPGKLS